MKYNLIKNSNIENYEELHFNQFAIGDIVTFDKADSWSTRPNLENKWFGIIINKKINGDMSKYLLEILGPYKIAKGIVLSFKEPAIVDSNDPSIVIEKDTWSCLHFKKVL